MGMYDNLHISKHLLPLTKQEIDIDFTNINWQTKDFDNILTEIYINDDLTISMEHFEYEEVPKEEDLIQMILDLKVYVAV